MTVVTTTYILVEDIGFGLGQKWGTVLGTAIGLAVAGIFLLIRPKLPPDEGRPLAPTPLSEAERNADSIAS